MRLIELFLLRAFLLVGLPLLLAVLLVGPQRLWSSVKRGWHWLWMKRLEPEQVLAQVVRQHEESVEAVKHVIEQAEAAEKEILRGIKQGEEHVAALESESDRATAAGDTDGATEAAFRLNLEKLALDNFREQLDRQRQVIVDNRRRRFLLELQLRQYEVGRSILLSQLAEAEQVEQQYAIARQFDPFNAVADWQRAEAAVQEKAINAKALERVQSDIAEFAAAPSADVDPAAIEAQLAELRAKAMEQSRPAKQTTNNRG
jgi:phage shock protein A